MKRSKTADSDMLSRFPTDWSFCFPRATSVGGAFFGQMVTLRLKRLPSPFRATEAPGSPLMIACQNG
jgi:hypothetical protein